MSNLLRGLVFFTICAVGGVIWLRLHSERAAAPAVQGAVATATSSETPLTADNYPATPKPNEPGRLIIPSISLNAYVQRVEADAQGQIGVPTHIALAGWFTGSVIPGEKGLSIIDGHVNQAKTAGVFAKLDALKPEDTIQVQVGSSTRLFSVMKVKTVPVAEATSELFSQDPQVPSQLNLITCDGVYDTATRNFTERTIVQARLLSP